MTMVLIFFVATFGMNFQVTNALMSRVVFHTGAGAFGLASAVFAVGALGGALLAARRARPTMRAAVRHVVRVQRARGGHRADAGLLVVPDPAGADRAGAAHADHRRELRRSSSAPRRRCAAGSWACTCWCSWAGRRSGRRWRAGWPRSFGPRMSLIAGGVISVVATVVIGAMLARTPPRARARVPAAPAAGPARRLRLTGCRLAGGGGRMAVCGCSSRSRRRPRCWRTWKPAWRRCGRPGLRCAGPAMMPGT